MGETMPLPLPLLREIVSMPAASNRLGTSLEVNLLPANLRVCNLRCAYCQFSATRWRERTLAAVGRWPTPDDIVIAVTQSLDALASLVGRITLTGHGEPTLHPEFESVVDHLRDVRDSRYPSVSLAVFSNATTAFWPSVRRSLARLDECYMKLDAGSDAMLRDMNGAMIALARIVEGLRGLDNVIVQGTFVRDAENGLDNTSDSAVTDWIGTLLQIRPSAVHVATLDGLPASARLQPVSLSRLIGIARHVSEAGLNAEVFASSPATGYPCSYGRQAGRQAR